jgi:acetyl-CoA carboxylase carboxyltransferase component
MDGRERVAPQHAQGKLTVRERLDCFADRGSLREFRGLIGDAEYAGNELVGFQPKGAVEGFCSVGGRKVIVFAGDLTVRGGSGGGRQGGLGNEPSANRRVIKWRLPYVRLLDAAGGSGRSIDELGRTYLPDGNMNSRTASSYSRWCRPYRRYWGRWRDCLPSTPALHTSTSWCAARASSSQAARP